MDYNALKSYLAPLSAYLSDESLTEIVINRPGEIWTESRHGWCVHALPENTFQWSQHIGVLVAGFNSKTMTQASPILSATLPDGQRIQVVRPPVTENGIISITIRKPSLNDFSLQELESFGAFDEFVIAKPVLKDFEVKMLELLEKKRIVEFLKLAVATGRNIVLCGKTGSGKTTMLKTLTNLIDVMERLITIEDVHEVNLNNHRNKVHLFYGKSGIEARDVLASCLRMKPDRILLAELRGGEAWEFLSALDSDHAGMTTAHAAGAEDCIYRIASLVRESEVGATMPNDIVLQKVRSTVDVVLYMQDWKVKEIYYSPEKKYGA
jgi:type IV secretion system protein VirB11